MRKINVYCGDVVAGQLVELAKGSYEFTYDDAYLEDNNMPPISVNLLRARRCIILTVFFLSLQICCQKVATAK